MKTETGRPYLGLALLTGLNLFNYLDRYVLASVVPPIKADLQLSDGEIGWLTSAFMIGYFATSPVFGYLGDRWPRRGLIVFGVTFWSAGTILSGFAHDYWTLLLCRMLVGLGEASYAVLAPTWISDLFTAERRNNALTIFYSATPVGSALGYLLGGFALGHGGWRTGFFWAGAPGLILALALLALAEPARRRDGEGDLASRGFSKSGLAGFSELFRIENYVLVLIGLTAYTFGLGAFAAWGPTFLNRVHGLELSFADQFFGGMLVIAGLLGTLIGGFAASAWRKKSRAGYAYLLTVSGGDDGPRSHGGVPERQHANRDGLPRRGDVPRLPADRPHQYAAYRKRARELAGARNGDLDFRHSPVGRFLEPGHCRAPCRLGLPGRRSGSRATKRYAHSSRRVQPFHPVLGLACLEAAAALSKRQLRRRIVILDAASCIRPPSIGEGPPARHACMRQPRLAHKHALHGR